MAEQTMEQRISALEAQLENKMVNEHFRDQAELIDRIGARFDRADSRLESILRDVAVIKHAVKAILTRLP